MSKKKDNFNEAVYSMFGVGKAPAEEKAVEVAAEEPVVEEAVMEEAPAVEAVVEAKEEPMGLTIVAEGVSMEGKLVSKGNVEISGHFKGDIEAKGVVTICNDYQGNITASELCIKNCSVTGDVNISGKVTLTEGSDIIGNVTAGEFTCCGNVKGDLNVEGNLNLKSQAVIEGNIAMGTLMVEQGAIIDGAISSKRG